MINAIAIDPAVLAARSPSELAMYLCAQQWVMGNRHGSSVRWTKLVEGDEYEIMQPIDSSVRDYPARVWDVVWVLAVVEARSALDVLRHILSMSESTE